ncbi:hypothetical protein AMS68_001414 [Peltaster fructicola]|uniref:Mitochondrial integral membrane protein n=1 Tax=Peltaster fructicola TaxID=286661 RepID=A0A6H0XMC0_9PEZI|nr:hypothetical protein AMS68_001414 [Peltaster fructicola]
MVSLWGSNKNGDDQAQDNHRESSDNMPRASEDEHHEPTERDRLLPREHGRPRQDGYLDPDDPAVSPYNLWSVRALRFLALVFASITFVWWVLLLVSIFVSPPGLNTRGSGFFDFSFTTLTSGILLTTVLFFSAPSLAMRVCQGVIAVLLVADLIIIVSVPRLRSEEGPPGIASVVWAALMCIFCVISDRVVAWGKREEEERLTGRPETRRTVREWLAVLLATIILAVFIVITLLLTATLILRATDAGLELEGSRVYVDGDKYRVHINCVGNVTDSHGKKLTTVLLEAAETPSEYDFEPWLYHAYKNGTIDRYCYWDRPGYAWSDNAPSPHSAGMSADNLATALATIGEEGPWVLVSAGYGSVVSRIFHSRNFKSVTGVMLVDGLHEDLLYRIASPAHGFVLWGWGILSPLGLQRVAGALFGGVSREDRVYGSKSYQSGKFIKAQLQESLVGDSLSKTEVRSTLPLLGGSDVPLVVVSSGIETRSDSEWEEKQKALTLTTSNLLSWDVVGKAPHYVWKTFEGRQVMEKRLGQLVKAAKVSRSD